MRLKTIARRYSRFSQHPIRLTTLLGVLLSLAGILTLISLIIFWGSDTHRYIVDIQRATDNRRDDPDFPLIIPPEFETSPSQRLRADQLWRAQAAIQAAAQDLVPAVDLPVPVFGLEFIDTKLVVEPESN